MKRHKIKTRWDICHNCITQYVRNKRDDEGSMVTSRLQLALDRCKDGIELKQWWTNPIMHNGVTRKVCEDCHYTLEHTIFTDRENM